MTDKELRKLNRLELLELLLEASKENEKLKEKIEELIVENKTSQNIEYLSVIMSQAENALKYAKSLTDALKTPSDKELSSNSDANKDIPIKPYSASDREIYRRMMCFFAENDDRLNMLPDDIAKDIRERIRMILEKRKTN